MSDNLNCPACNRPTTLLAHGVVAPWIVELCSIRDGSTTLQQCLECGLSFFSYRYSEQELTDLYSNYRSVDFYRLRHSWEPWYNESVNEAFSEQRANDRQIEDRRNYTRSRLEEAGVPLSELTGCLDFGGDHGQFIPSGVGGNLYVVEKGSDSKNAARGVTFLDSIDLVPEDVDLVLNCYVLEHLSVIHDVVDQMKMRLRDGGYVHFEVPLDKFAVSSLHRTNAYRLYLRFLSRHKRLFVAVDFYTGVYRHFFRRIPWLGIVKQSEHINYFEPLSLQKFMEGHGVQILSMSDPDLKYKVGAVRQGRIACTIR
jgi:SAM-dependent methyltransferase